MARRFQLWNLNSEIEIRSGPDELIVKMTTINNHVYLLSAENTLYHGTVQNETDDDLYVELTKVDNIKLIDIDCCKSYLYIIDVDGHIFKCDENLAIVSEIALIEDPKNCIHGVSSAKYKVKTEKLGVGDYGQLFVTNSGQLWASGYMPQIGINSESPKKVAFFDGRFIYDVNVGNDFAVALVSKQTKGDDTDNESSNGDVFITDCPHCLSQSQLTSPTSLNSENCPLGIKLQGSYDIETTSTSSKNDSSIGFDIKTNDTPNSEVKVNDCDKSEKNVIFRNTEAAKEFLSRQISWMSSAGEEYLVECAEKPTRIFKENVTNVACLVYESVKNVGDKVVTLSRHVSGSSDCNGVLEVANDEVPIPRTASKEEFSWSLSQGTSERDLSEHDKQERLSILLKNGSDLLNCEVWTWGNIYHGQLGIGDIMKRERPMIITKLSNVGVHKISVQSYHAAVLTLDGRAYLWGRNDYHQVTVENNIDQSSPRLFAVQSPEERIVDLTCGSFHTVVLTSRRKLHYFGKNADKIINLETKDGMDTITKEALERNGKFKIQTDLLSSFHYTLLNLRHPCRAFLNDSLVEEQKMLEEMLMVQSHLIKILQKKNASSDVLYENLCQYYVDLTNFVAANIHSLLQFSNEQISDYDIVMFKFVDEHFCVYKNYLHTLHDVVSIDGLTYISKQFEVSQSLYKLRPLITRGSESGKEIVSSLLAEPLHHLTMYNKTVETFINHSKKDNRLIDLQHRWNSFKEDELQRHREAENTRQFWLNSGKNLDHLKRPNRRLIRDSQKHPIHLLNAGRFSSHRFILFSDIFVHLNSSTVHVHDLMTLWVEPQQDELTQYQLLLKVPEDNLVLYTNEPEDKIEWFHTLQSAIKSALNKPDAHQPPVLRSASYVFTKNGLYKDVKYTGRWLNGKMQGSGRLEWNNGRVYVGQFSNGQMSGYGRMEIPNMGVYEGQWKDNQQNGVGIFTYANNDVYKGHFKDGLPHGHGSLKKGNFKSSIASLYIGDWLCGTKNGYGVMDDIITGEKYLGNWSDDKKQGSGIIVTSDGIYYEGTFNQDVLVGYGLMILEDQTYYEGDFRGTGILSGKGTLTLPSGHTIEGNLAGSWNEGIKISSGTFSKLNQPENTPTRLPKSFETLCTPVDQKWKALFKSCYQILLCSPDNNSKNVDTQKIWQNVAVFLSNSHQNTLKHRSAQTNINNSLNNLDTIPPFGREKLDRESFNDLKQYLMKAFDSSFHPLGLLLGDLSVAYTATYGGLHSHPLLLSHAVSELHSITKRLYEIVRLLFPALPMYGKENLIDDNNSDDEIISCHSLLYPIILPRVYSSLFTLFTLKNKQQEMQYWKRLMSWNKHSDYTLMAFLSVDQKFLKNDVDQTCPKSPLKDQLFLDAVETLQQLKTTFSPIEKLLVIRQTVEKMTPVVQQQLGQCYVWNMDDLFPIFLFVVVRARILQLGSELDLIEKFMEPSLESGELGLMFTTLKACYRQILIEKTSIN